MENCKFILDAFQMGLVFAEQYWIALIRNMSITDWGNVLIYTAGFIWGVELIPQLVKTHKTKCVNGISLSYFLACLLAYALYMIGSGMLGNWNIVIAHMPSLVLTFWMAVLILKYKER
jgi:uncharacterized protein with PQ loop repeat